MVKLFLFVQQTAINGRINSLPIHTQMPLRDHLKLSLALTGGTTQKVKEVKVVSLDLNL